LSGSLLHFNKFVCIPNILLTHPDDRDSDRNMSVNEYYMTHISYIRAFVGIVIWTEISFLMHRMEHIKCKYKGLKLILVGFYYLKLIELIHCVKTSVLIKEHHRVISLWKNVKIMGVTSILICLVFCKCFYHARLPLQQSILWHYRSHFIPKSHIPQTGKYENEWTFNP
jgi:hypothetical protein